MNRPTPVLRPGTTTDDLDDGKPVAVALGASTPLMETKVSTKAIGTVGQVGNGNTSTWSGKEKVYVYSFRSGTDEGYLQDVNQTTTTASEPLIDNEIATVATGSNTAKLTFENSKTYYYQGDKVYEFFGYHIDDAGTKATTNDPEPVKTKTSIHVPFKIDGGQDLMIGRTNKEEDIKAAGSEVIAPSKLYSAYAARRGVQPNLRFEHVLSRFTFNIIPGTYNSKDVKVTGIKVKSYTEGNLNIVGFDEDLTVDVSSMEELNVQNKVSGSEEMTAISAANPAAFVDANFFDTTNGKLKDNLTAQKVGEVMVIPGKTTYDLIVELDWVDNGKTEPIEGFTARINIDDVATASASQKGSTFEPGKSYDITLKIYGPEKVEISATLKDWVQVTMDEIDPDKDMEYFVEFESSELNLDYTAVASAVTQNLHFAANASVALESDETWFVVTYTGDAKTFSYTVLANDGTTARTAKVTATATWTVSTETITRTAVLNVTQKGKPSLSVENDDKDQTANAAASSTVSVPFTFANMALSDIEVTWDEKYDAYISSATLTETAGANAAAYSLELVLTENKGDVAREFAVSLAAPKYGATVVAPIVINITQSAPTTTPTPPTASITFDDGDAALTHDDVAKSGQTIELKWTVAGVDPTALVITSAVQNADPVVTDAVTAAATTAGLTLTVKENTSDTARTIIVTIKDKDTDPTFTKTITINQLGA